jgi:hypothetical protein
MAGACAGAAEVEEAGADGEDAVNESLSEAGQRGRAGSLGCGSGGVSFGMCGVGVGVPGGTVAGLSAVVGVGGVESVDAAGAVGGPVAGEADAGGTSGFVVLDWPSTKSTAKSPLLRTSSGFRTRLLVMSAVLKRRVPGGGPAELEPPRTDGRD